MLVDSVYFVNKNTDKSLQFKVGFNLQLYINIIKNKSNVVKLGSISKAMKYKLEMQFFLGF